MKTDARVEAVVVAYGFDEHLESCLKALRPLCPVTVIDNSSNQHVAALTGGLGLRYDDPRQNLGFAAGVNRGIRRCSLESDILLVNPDAVLTHATLDSVQACARGKRIAAVSPRLATPGSGEPQRVLWPYPSPWRMWRQAVLGGDGGPPSSSFAVGAVLLLTRAALNDVGAFDERFFLYAEETDWQRRALARGWRVALCETAFAEHVGAATSPNAVTRSALFHAGTETYIRKWFGVSGWQQYRAAAILGALIRAAVRGGERRSALARAWLYARGPRRVADLDP